MPRHDIVVMGASADGVEAMMTVLSALPRGFPASSESLKPDYVVPLAEIAPLLVTFIGKEVAGEAPTEEAGTQKRDLVAICPGCGGVLN